MGLSGMRGERGMAGLLGPTVGHHFYLLVIQANIKTFVFLELHFSASS